MQQGVNAIREKVWDASGRLRKLKAQLPTHQAEEVLDVLEVLEVADTGLEVLSGNMVLMSQQVDRVLAVVSQMHEDSLDALIAQLVRKPQHEDD